MMMNKMVLNLATVLLGATAIASAMPAQAADTKLMMPLDTALAAPDVKRKLDGSVKFFFAGQPTPKVIKKLGTDQTSLKTNAFGKADDVVCNRVFLSGLISLQKHAKSVGANAVINIVSNYGNIENPSATEFECHVGAIMGGVALKGDFVTIATDK